MEGWRIWKVKVSFQPEYPSLFFLIFFLWKLKIMFHMFHSSITLLLAKPILLLVLIGFNFKRLFIQGTILTEARLNEMRIGRNIDSPLLGFGVVFGVSETYHTRIVGHRRGFCNYLGLNG